MSTEWVDYVKEPMKYQALRPHFFSVVGGWVDGGGVGHGVGGFVVVGKGHGVGWCVCGGIGHGVDGVEGGGVVGPHDTPHHGGIRCPPCYFLTIW